MQKMKIRWAAAFLAGGALLLCTLACKRQQEPAVPETLNIYRGEVHAHTMQSDGKGTVDEAYAYVKGQGNIDFFAITDHDFSYSDYGHAAVQQIADQYDEPGVFAALYGYEQTWTYQSGGSGHINVLNSKNWYYSTEYALQQFYTSLLPEETGTVGQFNHPGNNWGNFEEYAYYTEAADAYMSLIEIKSPAYEFEYRLALAKGWHVSPMYNEDNHSKNWTTASPYVSCALAPELTREAIYESFRLNRTYTTSDPGLDVRYLVNNEWMGARLDSPDTLEFQISIDNAMGSLGSVSVVAEDGIVVAKKDAGGAHALDWSFTLPAKYAYYYVIVDGGDTWCITAPVWVENRELLSVGEISQVLLPDGTYVAEFDLTNTGKRIMTDVTVDLYQLPREGRVALDRMPSASQPVGKLKAGETVRVSVPFRYSIRDAAQNDRRVEVVAAGTSGKQTYADVACTVMSPLILTEMSLSTASRQTEENPYEFLEIYNNTGADLNLSDYTFWYYVKNGSVGYMDAEFPEITVPARSTVVIWLKSKASKLTVQDFNAYYGTSLTEGGNLAVMNRPVMMLRDYCVLCGISRSGVALYRIQYNWGSAIRLPRANGQSTQYAYANSYTATGRLLTEAADPTPGRLAEGQVPEYRD